MKNNIFLMQGNEACVQGAIDAGMRFFAGYPITPSTEIAELSAEKLPKVGGKFIQMEDEIASMGAVIGASLAGLKSMTATSGPGFSLKQENLGFACMAEIPCVIVNVQRGGPSTGLPTSPAQGEVMQSRWGTHGDHPIIVLSPSSVKEAYTFTIKAFNLSEKFRVPVILLMDEIVAHMRERVEIPKKDSIEIINRKKPKSKNYLPYEETEDLIPPMANFGEGYRYHVTGLTHNETGFPSTKPNNAKKQINRLMNKIDIHRKDIIEYDEFQVEDAETIIIAFGSVARSAKSAVKEARNHGKKIGLFRPKTIWPFPEERLQQLARHVKNIIVTEMNKGQLVLEIERIVKNDTQIDFLGKANGEIITPDEILSKIEEVK
ncbi:2-oxoacid:acceptor oxidoreductase subunit alpha [Garciella nitratireducens]|uniref:2-oxoglutarate ferredoxin oxidoreductase subunit alpha n=1 Tax=Garciella nitratireducens DSM 15102 TaxID=1121911 RepID=A0A1T4JV36_9FIRM|nr:2-oxoacid:acceptor oxidoreductase subunit alpha [Garciella nitratireducens]RBP45591.1 2-oxoglutarate ferredoxin oxidoreductase subunit alpha [Garciella nitratireducens]SJZ34003.1 2-oxoglutarate ferredoxin oxidoreductase subunit alpha [Garciella nitratireducens DSM 15102]